MLQLIDNELQTGEFREDILKGLTYKQYMTTIDRSVHYVSLIE